MADTVELWQKSVAQEMYMIVGWRQWADGGGVSSALPQYLVEHLGASQIGRIRPEGFYLFQLPGLHDLLRPQVKLQDGQLRELRSPDNQIYYWEQDGKGLVILLGDEPQLNVEGYAEALFQVAQALGVQRMAAVGGVYAPVPFELHREISCTYSLPRMREELDEYGVGFSDYEGGVSIGSYLMERAAQLDMEYLVFYAMVPYFDLSQFSPELDGVGVEEDYKAWYDVMVRLSHMFNLRLDLSDLRRRGEALIEVMSARLAEMSEAAPDLPLEDFMAQLKEGFTEREFAPLEDVWESELGDLFGDGDEGIGTRE